MKATTVVIGAGIAGLGAAWALRDDPDLLVLDAGDHVGGNAVTHHVADLDVDVDLGFIVFNDDTYPEFIDLLDRLDVAIAPSDMSLSVQAPTGDFEGSAAGLLGSGRWRSRRSWQRLVGILALGRRSRALADRGATVGSSRAVLGDAVVDDYVIPMVSAIWSSPGADVERMPLASVVTFFDQHRLFDLVDRPQWRTVQGGSRHYVEAMVDRLAGTVRHDSVVTGLAREGDGWVVEVDGGQRDRERVHADDVVLATPADTARWLLADAASAHQHDLLGAFSFSDNRAVLHRDPSVMPADRSLWASWNVVAGQDVAVTYWMNNLQPLATDTDLFVTLNPSRPLAGTITTRDFRHPLLTPEAVAAQPRLHTIQGVGHAWFCGAWTGFGFHEDGLESGLAVGAAIADAEGPPRRAGRPAAAVVAP